MTWRTIDIEALSAASQNLIGYGKRHVVARSIGTGQHAAIEIRIRLEMPTSHRARDRRSGGTQIRVKIACGQRLETRLVVHVLPASGQQQQGDYPWRKKPLAEAQHNQLGTSETD